MTQLILKLENLEMFRHPIVLTACARYLLLQLSLRFQQNVEAAAQATAQSQTSLCPVIRLAEWSEFTTVAGSGIALKHIRAQMVSRSGRRATRTTGNAIPNANLTLILTLTLTLTVTLTVTLT